MPAPKYSLEVQEKKIIDAAEKCIGESTIMDFAMSTLAKEAGMSMGTVYKHIQTKEDVLLALAVRNLNALRETIEKTLALPLTTPERMIAVFMFSPEKTGMYNFAAQLQLMVSNEAVIARSSPRWVERTTRLGARLDQLFYDAFYEACDSGELKVSDEDREYIVEQMQIALSSLHSGFVQVSMLRAVRLRLLDDDRLATPPASMDHLIESAKRIMNTYPWKKPLTQHGVEKTKALLEKAGLR